jgi:hypothetical protein
MVNPKSLSNLTPFKPGFDPHRNVKGRGPGFPGLIRYALDLGAGNDNGRPITVEESMLLKIVQTAIDDSVRPRERLRATTWIFDTLYGKPGVYHGEDDYEEYD